MTPTVRLTPEQVALLQAEADRLSLSLAEYVRRRLLGDTSQVATDDVARLAAIDTAQGSLAGSGISSEDFMNEKHAEQQLCVLRYY